MPSPDPTTTGTATAESSGGLWSSPLGPIFRYWVPVVAYVVLIFWVSSLTGINIPGGGSGIDKVVHALEYGVLCYLLVRALRGPGIVSSTGVAGGISLIVGLVVALADELYQSTVPGRESDPADFTADAVGLVLAVLVYAVRHAGGRRR